MNQALTLLHFLGTYLRFVLTALQLLGVARIQECMRQHSRQALMQKLKAAHRLQLGHYRYPS